MKTFVLAAALISFASATAPISGTSDATQMKVAEFGDPIIDFLCEYVCPNHPMCGGGGEESLG